MGRRIFLYAGVTAFSYAVLKGLKAYAGLEVILGAVERVAVEADDPLKLGETIELDGDHLDVTLDDEAHVIDVTEED